MAANYPINLYFPESRALFEESFPLYRERTKAILHLIKEDRSLSRFDAFNKRLKIACGLQFQFSDQLNITKPDTRACYELMYRIADIWYAYEHLLSVSNDDLPRMNTSKVALFHSDVFEAIGLPRIERCFSTLFAANVTDESKWRRELYPVLAYFINNTNGATQKALRRCSNAVKEKRTVEFEHLLALAYGMRNLYVHEGVMAALGTRDYALKRRLYQVVLDCLILSCIFVGNEYARRVLARMEPSELVPNGGSELENCVGLSDT